MILNALENCIKSAIRKNWDKIFIAVDLHDTVVIGNYKTDELPTTFLPMAKETLQYLSTRKDVCLIMYTCSHPHEIEKYKEFFIANGINFQYVNENPEVPNNALGCYDTKMYFNIVLDDKAGFIAEYWQIIHDFFVKTPILLQQEVTA